MRSSQYSSPFLIFSRVLASSAYVCSCRTVIGDGVRAMESAEEDIEGQQLNKRESRADILEAELGRDLRRDNALFGADNEVTRACFGCTTN